MPQPVYSNGNWPIGCGVGCLGRPLALTLRQTRKVGYLPSVALIISSYESFHQLSSRPKQIPISLTACTLAADRSSELRHCPRQAGPGILVMPD